MNPLDEARRQLLEKALAMGPDQLNKMEHADLYQARMGATPEQQNKLAGAEHRAYARETVRNDPMEALPLAISTLLYQPYKLLRGNTRSNASLDQAIQGLTGIGEGVIEYGERKALALQNMFESLAGPEAPKQ